MNLDGEHSICWVSRWKRIGDDELSTTKGVDWK